MIVKKNNKVVIKSSHAIAKPQTQYIKAADDDDDMGFDDYAMDDNMDDNDVVDAIDDVADNVEDLQDAVDEIKDDETEITINNNIADHYIAECDRCNGIFISAVVDSDQQIDHVTGTCPLCGKETEQYLKWVIRPVE